MIAGLDQDAIDAVAHHLGDRAGPGGDDDRPQLEGFLDGDEEAIRPQERQDDALRVFQPGPPGLATPSRVPEEDVQRSLARAAPWRRGGSGCGRAGSRSTPPRKTARPAL